MTENHWFKKRTSTLDIGRPANWKGWVALILFVFLFALLAQMIGVWAFAGLKPLVAGVWLIALMLVLVGVFVKICNHFSPAGDDT